MKLLLFAGFLLCILTVLFAILAHEKKGFAIPADSSPGAK